MDENEVEAVTRSWEEALANHDVEGILACYTPDATLVSRWTSSK
ncbi:MAG: hypothetical protein JWP55_2373 [Mycobacterium sp.]|jgi:uncharacterized protein (TIGR02246 family)|nr:hypothetical protein [Mycobacterium sp.]